MEIVTKPMTKVPRRRKMTPRDMAELARRLREAAEEFDEVADKMRKERIDELMVDGFRGVEDGFENLGKFLFNAKKSLPLL